MCPSPTHGKQILPCARRLTHGEERFAVGSLRRQRFAVGHTRQSLCRVYFGLRRVPQAHGKLLFSGSGTDALAVARIMEHRT